MNHCSELKIVSVLNFQVIKHWTLTNAISVMNTRILEPRSISTGDYLFSPEKNQDTQKLSLRLHSISQLWMLVNRGSLLSWKERLPRHNLVLNSNSSTNQLSNVEKVCITSCNTELSSRRMALRTLTS